ncbi:protein zds1 [Pseudomyrmex gracilis]|uniref:protein zds1 n=1 Tax=Pseudomyrmex gracilis TaxID=219809 RepID=UPI000995BCA4|nr:protein zds1 [Pseudomyrmex gracilis]
MRLEAELSLCSDAEDVVNSAPAKFPDTTERKSLDYHTDENEDAASRTSDGGKLSRTRMSETNENEIRAVVTGRGMDLFGGQKINPSKERVALPSRASNEDAMESDSSEELQYGPGIVNKLKSKYLNLTLRETNKSRVSVQRFRRAASLEDLLDRDDEEAPGHEKNVTGRKYSKRSGGGVANAAKTDRYRNASRGNDSMKRARSVETLMRYNSVTTDEAAARQVPVSRPATNGVRQEPVNDHIILVDRTSVKIESRLGEIDRPKPVNKPKRIKPVLAETERPPQDLVKTTMRIFEVSARRLKPKGEVAAKVATFKTINDTLKAQKKLVPKPPVQPKPFVNGGARAGIAASPKKIVLPQKPTAELIETQDGKEEYHIDGVITEPIVQSVSSVVSRFQQIEKSHSPSPSPEPAVYKLRFSPANSPEPQSCKSKSAALEISVKSPPVTPVLSPRILSPRLQSPPSPVKDAIRQGSQSPSSPVKDPIRIQIPNSLHKPPLPSPPVKDSSKTELESIKVRLLIEKDSPRTNVEHTWQPVRVPESFEERKDEDASRVAVANEEDSAEKETAEAKTISKTALDNISKAGITMQFNFGDQPTSDKSYLPGAKHNGQQNSAEDDPGDKIESGASDVRVTSSEATCRLQERLEPEKETKLESGKEDADQKLIVPETKPIGAICSLSLIKPATTHSQQSNNETKTIRSQQKNEFSPPQKQIGIIRPLVSTKTQHPQQNLSNRELEKNLINRVKSIEQPTKVVVSLKSADEIQPAKKTSAGSGLWDTKPWNQQNNTMVFNFSNRKDVPDYIENDGLIIRRKREKPKTVGDGGIIVLDATLDASTTDDAEWEISGGPPSPCDVSFLNDNVLINGRSNLSRTPRNHKHRIQFDDTATRTFEYPSEASILEGETSSVDGETSSSVEKQQQSALNNKTSSTVSSTTSMPSLLGGGGLASYTPSKVDLTSEGFELGITRAVSTTAPVAGTASSGQTESSSEVEYLRPAQDAGAWGSETTGDLLY